MLYKTIIISLLFYMTLVADEKVSLQLQWKHQFQFAGYYIAKEKGYYSEAGIDVTIKEYDYGLDVVEEVLSGRATFGVGRTSLYIDRTNGKDVVVLAAIFQTSPLVLLGLASSHLQLEEGLEGKTMMVTADAGSSVPLMAMIKANGSDPEKMTLLPHSFDLEDLIAKKTDLMASYSSNEPFRLERRGIAYTVFDPKDSGFDFYDDLLFTSGEQVRTEHLQTKVFKEASLKGWQYAFEHMEETVGLIMQKYNTQKRSKEELLYEARTLKKLAYYKTKKIGEMRTEKFQRIADVYRIMGLVKERVDLDAFMHYKCTHLLTPVEEQWIRGHRNVDYAGYSARLPYEGFDKDGSYIGIIGEYVSLIETKTGLDFHPQEIKGFDEAVKLGKEEKIDMVGGTVPQGDELDFLPSEVFRQTKVVFVGRNDQHYVENIDDVTSKRLGLVNKGRYASILRSKHPKITFIEVRTVREGLAQVADGSLDLLLAPIDIVTDMIAQRGLHDLKIVGKSEVETEQRFYVHKDRPMLLSIINKAIMHTDERERIAIEKKWLTQKYVEKTDYALLWRVLGLFVALSLLMLYRQRWLSQYNHELLVKQKELEANNEEFSALFHTSPEGLFIFENGRCVDINEGAMGFFGHKSRSEALGKDPYFFLSPRSHAIAREHIEQQSTKPYEAETAKDNTPILLLGRDVKTSKRAIRIVSVVDLTTVKEQERVIAEQSKMVSLGEMITNISHHWRQPLAVIGMEANSILADIDLDTVETEQLRVEVTKIAQQTQQLSASIVDFGYIVGEDKERRRFDMIQIVEKALRTQSAKISDKHIVLKKELEPGLLVTNYEHALMQVFVNIIDNACDALMKVEADERLLIVSARYDADRVIVSFRDSGSGIAAEMLEKMFEPYTTIKHKSVGTGMGLYFVYKTITEKVEGEISAKNVTFDDEGKHYSGAEITIVIGVDGGLLHPDKGVVDES